MSISGSVEELSEADLKDKIERYITDNRIKCSLTADVGELVNYIYHDMAGLSFITRDRLFERSGFEEININAWNDVEIVSGGQRVKTDYSFLSPQHAIDIHARMLRKTKTTFNDVIPRATADIGGGIRITVEKVPVLDEDVAVASSIRKVNVADIGREVQEADGVFLPEMMVYCCCARSTGFRSASQAAPARVRPPWAGVSSPLPPGRCAPLPSRRTAASGILSERRAARSSTASSTPAQSRIKTILP